MDNNQILQRLTAVVEKHLGAVTIDNARPLTGGAASSTWKFDVVGGDGRRSLILRCAETEEQISTGLQKSLEAQVQQAAFVGGVPAAEVLFTLAPSDQLGDGYVMDCLAGESIPRKILRNKEFDCVRPNLAAQCGSILARIHALTPPKELSVLTAAEQIRRQAADYRQYNQPLPVFELALRWLERNQPKQNNLTLVHGDFRNGNLLVTPEQGINGVLDWELAHQGDPMEDLGWLCVNSWRFGNRHLPVGGFGSREALFAAYEQAAGIKVDSKAVHFWEVFGVLKWGVICLFMCKADMKNDICSVERAAIGRRVSETEVDLLTLLAAGVES
ncbi:phosphotransferase family protein [Halioxenophilus sp. WMMB6]|uniref:phosphotransferase family protein n=1 Tax=Halioxenophilus sp. WMMB6 TaxID=3073815 RepID=UPI00295E430F|nr:phosphotransferase family protein [Halioxenophilus sp. WMMB6]